MMNTGGSDECKSLWPISSVHAPPLLLSSTDIKKVGPLIFNPHHHHYHDHLFNSPFVSPQIPPPYPNLTLSRFLKTSSSILPFTTTSIASQLSSPSFLNHPNHRLLAHNALQLMRCPGTNSTLAFFPTGSNSDQVGVLVLTVEDSRLNVTESDTSLSHHCHHHRILNISVSPLPDCQFDTGPGIIFTCLFSKYMLFFFRMEHLLIYGFQIL